ncbi:MAG: peptidoglycan DD-metalloendopeptidase family protein, partial [Acidobacteria bacterium]|nr:peptidoglycan DD-metalloendopeptidase family protein [Acidobacteriota bacterium]NIQ86491.1 peptidoglycan DD-metalloendopeptidase family protein [Acidobacteriota bacterium]
EMQSLYAHNSALLVRLGENVKQGQTIARVGRTGNATTDHCHFEIRLNDRRVDPMHWLSPERRAAR